MRSLPIIVIEVPLDDATSSATQPSRIVIKLSLATTPQGETKADELQAAEATKRAMEEVGALGAPQIVTQVDLAISTGADIATGLQTFENTWGVLLQRMATFNKIVAGIAEVSGIRDLAPFLSESRIDSPLHVVGLVGDIGRESGLCHLPRHACQCLSPH